MNIKNNISPGIYINENSVNDNNNIINNNNNNNNSLNKQIKNNSYIVDEISSEFIVLENNEIIELEN